MTRTCPVCVTFSTLNSFFDMLDNLSLDTNILGVIKKPLFIKFSRHSAAIFIFLELLTLVRKMCACCLFHLGLPIG